MHQYNGRPVNETVDVFVSRDVIDSFGNLDSLNKGKVGRPFRYANSVILMMCTVRGYFGLPYRQTEEFAKLIGGMWGASTPSYTQICRRQKTLKVPLLEIERNDNGGRPLDIIVDSSGPKVSNRGEWMRQRWGVRRGFVKLHITCDRKTHRIGSIQVADGHVSETTELEPLVTSSKERVGNVRRVFGDTAFD